ncbi:MAG: hypothetical protein CMJ78_09225 [Planctomycetaceae bacterium]|nr:hypothetical protein [Planctomycetaceae bacterium]
MRKQLLNLLGNEFDTCRCQLDKAFRNNTQGLRSTRRFGFQVEPLESRLLLSRDGLFPNRGAAPPAEIGEFDPGEEADQDSSQNNEASENNEAGPSNGNGNNANASNNSNASNGNSSNSNPSNPPINNSAPPPIVDPITVIQPIVTFEPIGSVIQPVDVIAFRRGVVVDTIDNHESDEESDADNSNEGEQEIDRHKDDSVVNLIETDDRTEAETENDQHGLEEDRHTERDDDGQETPVVDDSEPRVAVVNSESAATTHHDYDAAAQVQPVEEPIAVAPGQVTEPTEDHSLEFLKHVARTTDQQEPAEDALPASVSTPPLIHVQVGADQAYSYVAAPLFAFMLGALQRRQDIAGGYDPISIPSPGLPLNRDGSPADRKKKSKAKTDDGIISSQPATNGPQAIPTEESAASHRLRQAVRTIDAQFARAELMDLVSDMPEEGSSYDQLANFESEEETLGLEAASLSLGGAIAAGALTTAATSVAIAKAQGRTKQGRLQTPKAPSYTGETIVRPIAD